jgi:ATP synthase protein I
VLVQAAVGALACLLAGLFSAQASLAWSAAYGAAVVVLPSALLARGMTAARRSATGLAMRFLVWEMLKIGAAIALMLIAAKTVPDLSWPVFLGVMVVCMKVNWFALLWRGDR